MIDTTSRFLDGDENSADTFLRFYNNTLMLLKRENIASLRLDHPGKDTSRGTRGSSAKYGDIDYEWAIEDKGVERTLTCTKSRTGNVDKGKVIALRVHGVTEISDHFWHEWDYKAELTPENKQLQEDLKLLTDMGIADLGRRAIQEKLAIRGVKMGVERIDAARKARKNCVGDVSEQKSGIVSEMCREESILAG